MITVWYSSWVVILLAPIVGASLGFLIGQVIKWWVTDPPKQGYDIAFILIAVGILWVIWHIWTIVSRIPDLGLAWVLGILLFFECLVPGYFAYNQQIGRK